MARKYLCALMAALILLCCIGCSRETVPAPTTEAVTEPTTEPVTESTEAPTTEPETEPTTEPTEPPLVLHSGMREDGSFDAGTLFIGDSLTFQMIMGYLKPNNLLGDAKYTAQCGSQLTVFFDGSRIACSAVDTLASPEFDGMQFHEAAASLGEDATAIYLMWGTNFTKDASADSYIEIVDYLLEHCPNATVHLQLVPYAKNNTVPYNTVNERIQGAYSHYQERGEPRVLLVDTFTAIGKALSSDGVHITDTGKARWYQAIVDHAAELELPQ